MTEAGVPMQVTAWFGLLAPAGTPDAVVERIQQSARRAMQTAEVRQRFADLGGVPGGETPGRVRRLHRPGTQELGPDRQGRRPVAGIVLPSRPSPPSHARRHRRPAAPALWLAARTRRAAGQPAPPPPPPWPWTAAASTTPRCAWAWTAWPCACNARAWAPATWWPSARGSSPEYVLAFLGALRAGVAVAPLAPSATAGHLSAMLDNCGAGWCCATRTPPRNGRCRADRICNAWPWTALSKPACRGRNGWLRTKRTMARHPRPSTPSPTGLQRHLLLGHHGCAQGHRPVLGHALGPRAARHPQRLRPDAVSLCATPLYSQHHPGRGPAHPGAGRHPGADAQVRRGALPGTGRAPPCHPHHARARAVPAAECSARGSTAPT